MKLVIEGDTPNAIYSQLLEWVDFYQQGDVPFPAVGVSTNTNGGPAPASTGLGPAPRCQNCGGEVYDNRQDRKGNGPHFRCKSCKYGGWVGKDGAISWKPPINA